jgi:hypothetical protein
LGICSHIPRGSPTTSRSSAATTPTGKDHDVLTLLQRATSCTSRRGHRGVIAIRGRAAGTDRRARLRWRFAGYLRHRIFERAGMPTAVAHEDGVDTVAHRASLLA